jgi:branched-chain amino acid transport system ATP-binding protein
MSALLEISALEAGYGASQVLFGIDAVIDEGETVTLLGRNGMGKTTTVRAILGLAGVRRGSIGWRGESIVGRPTERIAALGIALVPEGRQIFANLTVRENLVAFAENRIASRDSWTLAKVWDFFPQLRDRAGHLGNELSGGEQQMLAIGRALMTNPALLILDEASEGLAPLIRDEVWACLHALRAAGQTLLVIDKHIEHLLRLADRHIILERGRVVWAGSSDALSSDPALWQRYLGV